jgi:hypothetical protein
LLRKTSYGVGAPNALELVAVNGRILSRNERAARYSTQRRDHHFPDWPAAAESAWAELLFLFPGRPRQSVVVREHVHRCLDDALSIAHSHQAHWNPFIQFCGLPNEAQQGSRAPRYMWGDGLAGVRLWLIGSDVGVNAVPGLHDATRMVATKSPPKHRPRFAL